MRGSDEHSGSLFSYVDLETRVPKEHEDRDGVASKRTCFRPLRDYLGHFLLSRHDLFLILLRDQTDTCGPDLH